jgi:predicted anti-sigma-YlaC factor YlaD
MPGTFRAPGLHYSGMDCDSIRTAVSAGLDGEDPGVPPDVTEAHLDGCAACRQWQQRTHAITRRVRLGGYALDHDLVPGALAALAAPGKRQPAWLRAGLVAAALAQLAVTVPLLVLGHDHDAGRHAAHELGSFDLALAIAFAAGAVRPALSAGLAWPCGIAGLGLACTAVADLVAGQTPGADEAQHLVAVAGALLLAWQARVRGAAPAGDLPAALPARPGLAGDLPAHPAARLGRAPAGAAPHPGPGAARTAAWALRSGERAG